MKWYIAMMATHIAHDHLPERRIEILDDFDTLMTYRNESLIRVQAGGIEYAVQKGKLFSFRMTIKEE